MGGSLYNKIPLGRRSAIFNVSRLQLAGVSAVVLIVGAIFLIVQ